MLKFVNLEQEIRVVEHLLPFEGEALSLGDVLRLGTNVGDGEVAIQPRFIPEAGEPTGNQLVSGIVGIQEAFRHLGFGAAGIGELERDAFR